MVDERGVQARPRCRSGVRAGCRFLLPLPLRRRIFLLSDEPYRRLRFDGRGFTSPAAVYPWTLISYSYGKILLTPGQRLGYLALSPLMPDETRKAIREATFSAQMALGWTFPSALMQYSVPALESLSIDQAALARRRDLLIVALTDAGYRPLDPEGTPSEKLRLLPRAANGRPTSA